MSIRAGYQAILFDIGGPLQYDVNGARAAGMDVVLLDRSGVSAFQGPRIRSLTQLVGFLA